MQTEIKRQFLHILIGILYIVILFFLPIEHSIPALIAIFAIGSFLSYTHAHLTPLPFLKDILSRVERDKEIHIPGRAALSFTLGVLLASIVFFPFDKMVLIGAVTAVTFGDGFSTLIGKAAGKHRTIGNRTMEGTIGGTVAAALTLMVFFPLEVALGAAIFAMLAEYIPINDSYTIPLIAGIVLAILI